METSGAVKIVLISPNGPLYRHRGGILRRSLRYAPLTLTTLASLVPPDIDARLTIIDEGIDEVPPNHDADLVGMTVITGTAPRAYQLAAWFRARGIPVVRSAAAKRSNRASRSGTSLTRRTSCRYVVPSPE